LTCALVMLAPTARPEAAARRPLRLWLPSACPQNAGPCQRALPDTKRRAAAAPVAWQALAGAPPRDRTRPAPSWRPSTRCLIGTAPQVTQPRVAWLPGTCTLTGIPCPGRSRQARAH